VVNRSEVEVRAPKEGARAHSRSKGAAQNGPSVATLWIYHHRVLNFVDTLLARLSELCLCSLTSFQHHKNHTLLTYPRLHTISRHNSVRSITVVCVSLAALKLLHLRQIAPSSSVLEHNGGPIEGMHTLSCLGHDRSSVMELALVLLSYVLCQNVVEELLRHFLKRL
jgi:hypothetical protein